MGEETKALWEIKYKSGYTMGTLYFHCMEGQVENMFRAVARRDFRQPVELFTYHLAGEVIDFDEYKSLVEEMISMEDLCNCGNPKMEESDYCKECV